MTDDLMPFSQGGNQLSERDRNRGPNASPHWLTQAGQLDRRNEDTHVVAIRQAVRDVELARVEVAKKLAVETAVMDADARKVTEQKFHLHRAQKESQILGSDDPELRAKFAVLDDDLFARYRQIGMEGRS